jgi:hypothetical protein
MDEDEDCNLTDIIYKDMANVERSDSQYLSVGRRMMINHALLLPKTVLLNTVVGKRRRGGQRNKWTDNTKEWTGHGFTKE